MPKKWPRSGVTLNSGLNVVRKAISQTHFLFLSCAKILLSANSVSYLVCSIAQI